MKKNIAKLSVTIAESMDNDSGDDDVEIPPFDFSSHVLDKVIKFCKRYSIEPSEFLLIMLRRTNSNFEL